MAQQPWFDGDTAGWVPALRYLLGAGGGQLDPSLITERNWVVFTGGIHVPIREERTQEPWNHWQPADGHDSWNRLTMYRPVQQGPLAANRYYQIIHAEFVFWGSNGGGYDLSPARQGQELIAVSRAVIDPLPRNDVLGAQSFRDAAAVLRALLTWAGDAGNDALADLMSVINNGGSGFEGSAAQALWWTLADLQFGLTDLRTIVEVPDSWPVRLDESAVAIDKFVQDMQGAWNEFVRYPYHDPNWMVRAVIDTIMAQITEQSDYLLEHTDIKWPEPTSPWNFTFPPELGGGTHDLASAAGWFNLDFNLRWLWGNEFSRLENAAIQATQPLVSAYTSLDEAFTRGVRDRLHLPRPDGMVPDPPATDTPPPDIPEIDPPDIEPPDTTGGTPPPDIPAAEVPEGIGGDGGGGTPPPDIPAAEVPEGLGGGGGTPPPDIPGSAGGSGVGDLPPPDISGADGLGGLGGGAVPPDIPGTDVPGGTGGTPPQGSSGGGLGGAGGIPPAGIPPTLGGLGGSGAAGGTGAPDVSGAGAGGVRPGTGIGRGPTLTDPADIGSPESRQVGPDELGGGSTGGGVIGPLGNPPPGYTPPGSVGDVLTPGYANAAGGGGTLGAGAGGPAGSAGGGLAGLAGSAGAGGPGGVAGAGAGAGMPFMPMPMPMSGMGGGGAGQGEREREKTVWLAEDESVWGTDPECAPSVVGADEGDEWEYEGTRRAPSTARPGSSQPYEPARGRPRAQS